MDEKTKTHTKELRKNMTEAEKKLWTLLRSRRFVRHKFRRQVPLGPYILDFVCFEERLIIEVDGSQHMDQATYDLKRTAYFQEKSYRVIRVWNNDVLGKLPSVSQLIFDQLSTPHPDPLPQGEREAS